jgi:4-hydroxybenzoate polyprenyltransferase
LRVAARIAWEAMAFRLRRREANNIMTSLSLALAFRLPWLDLGYRAVFAILLNLYVYLMNDCFDIELDLASPQKDQAKARYMAEHRRTAIGTVVGLGVLLLGLGLLHSSLLALAWLANTIVVLSYSGWIKRWPLVDVLAMAVWGGTMALVGLPVDALPGWLRELVPGVVGFSGAGSVVGSALAFFGWKLVGLLALLCSVFEVIQVVRDEPADRAAGIVTTGVLVGARGAAWVFRALVLAAAAYGGLVLHTPIPAVLLLTALLPLTPERADRTWDLCRVLFGVVWVALLALVYLGK